MGSFSLQCSCLENPRDGGAWWAHRVGHDGSDLAAAVAAAMHRKIIHHSKMEFILGVQDWFTFRNNQNNLSCYYSKNIYLIISIDMEEHLVKFSIHLGRCKIFHKRVLNRNAFNLIKHVFKSPAVSSALTGEILKSLLLRERVRHGVQHRCFCSSVYCREYPLQ